MLDVLGRDVHTAAIPAAIFVVAGKDKGTWESSGAFMPSLSGPSSGHCQRQMDLWPLLVLLLI